MFASGVHGCPVAEAVQTRMFAPAIGRPCALKTISSLREPCALATGALPSIPASTVAQHQSVTASARAAAKLRLLRTAVFALTVFPIL